jgi:hypothetical protein
MRRFKMVDMCKGKRKLCLQGTDDVLLVGLHMVGKGWKFRLSTTWHPSLYFIFFFQLIHPSHIFLATPLLSFYSFILIFFLLFLYFSIIIFFLYFPYSYFSLYFPSLDIFTKLSTPLFLACIQSEILNKPC